MINPQESCSDYWMRQFRANNPEVANTVERKRIQKLLEDSQRAVGASTAEQSKRGGIARLESISAQPTLSVAQIVSSAILVRRGLGLTQAGFAERLNISPRTLRDWEQGRRQPSGAALTLLSWVVDQPERIRR